MQVVFILNGVDVPVEAEEDSPLSKVVADALELSGNDTRPVDQWVVRDEYGVTMPMSESVGRFNFDPNVRLYLMPQIGVGGSLKGLVKQVVGSLTPREQEVLKKRFSSDEHNEVTEYAIKQMASRIKKFPVREGYEKEPENKVDIVKVVEHYDVKLVARGRMHVGMCPFCDEPSDWYPTLFANRDTGRFFCFKCSKKGTPIDFVVEMSAGLLDFTHAMRMLSDPKYKKDKAMKIRATSDKIFIRRCKSKEVTEGGIIIPEAAKEKAAEGIVVSAGPGRCLQSGVFVETTVKEGDKVLLPSWGAEVDIDGEKMIVVPEESILGVFEEE